jgi:hypothetical protein
MKNFMKQLKFALFLLSGALILSSCSNSTSSDDDEEHLDPFGVTMIMNGVEIAKQENGVVTYNEGDYLELQTGEETNIINIRWISEDGDRFVPDEDAYNLQWVIDDENVLEVEQHEEDGKWAFHLKGVGAGESEIRFSLFHVDHADFTSLPFEVHVETAVSSSQITDETGSVLVRIDEDGNADSGLTINAGETSGSHIIYLFDEEGANLSDYADEMELEFHVEDESLATAELVEVDGRFGFVLTGIEAGETAFHFEILAGEHDHDHDDDDDHDHEDDDHDHDDEELVIYESPDISLTVN